MTMRGVLRRLVSALPGRKKKICLALAVFAGNLALDRLTKLLALRFLKGRGVISLLHNLVMLYFTENSGAFLSMGADWNPAIKYLVLLYIPLLICIAVFFWLLFRENSTARIIIIATLTGGGISNLMDRFFNAFRVIDFLNFGIGSFRTGILNVADISVTFGAVLLLLREICFSIKLREKKNSPPGGELWKSGAEHDTINSMSDCIFCKIVRGEIPSKKIFEDGDILAFNDAAPEAPVHFLVIPKQHRRNIYELGDADRDMAGRLLIKAQELAQELGCAERGARFVINCKSDGGQTVDHLHIHVLGGRPLDWPPG
jgi:histidine triad (HIT) family protein